MEFLTNLMFSLEAVLGSLWRNLVDLTQYQLLWGFVLGFVVATLLYAFLMTGTPNFDSQVHSTEKVSKVKILLLVDVVLLLLFVLMLLLKF